MYSLAVKSIMRISFFILFFLFLLSCDGAKKTEITLFSELDSFPDSSPVPVPPPASPEPPPSSGDCASGLATEYDEIGGGSTSDPYILCTEDQLRDLAINGCSNIVSAACGSAFALGQSISLTQPWIPIG